MSQYPHGYCPTCSKYVALKSDGTLWLHKAPAIDLISEIDPDYCASSFQPAMPAHRVDLDHLLNDADFTPATEGVRLTNEQLWARLLLMTTEERMKFLAMMQEAAHDGQLCFMKNHAGLEHEANFWRERAITYRARMHKALTIAHYWRKVFRAMRDMADRQVSIAYYDIDGILEDSKPR